MDALDGKEPEAVDLCVSVDDAQGDRSDPLGSIATFLQADALCAASIKITVRFLR